MRTTVEHIVSQIRTQLSTYRNEFVVLRDELTPATTEFSIGPTLPPNVRVGTILSIGLERMRVLDVNPGPRMVTVVRSWNSQTPPQSHAAGSDVWVNSRFDGPSIADALYDEIQSWDSDLFHVDDAIVDVKSTQQLVPLPVEFTDALGVISVRRRHRHRFDGGNDDVWPEVSFRVVWGKMLPGASQSGMNIRLINADDVGGQLHITVGRPFLLTYWHPDTDLVGDVGLRPSMLDCLKMGAVWRLVSANEIGRSARNTQGETRVAEETEAGAVGQEALRLYALYQRRLNAEVMRFRSQFPLRRS